MAKDRPAASVPFSWRSLFPPLLLSAAAAACVWAFSAKVEADRDGSLRDAEAYRDYAAAEAGGILAAAGDVERELVERRRSGREAQDRNLRMEAQAVLDAVHRRLAAILEKQKERRPARREVGAFSPGFSVLARNLEIAPGFPGTDRFLDALRANAPELASLLPSGCRLALVENNARELLSLGGGAASSGGAVVSTLRDLMFDGGGGYRQWTLHIELSAPDNHPVPTVGELSRLLDERFANSRIDDAVWRGWIFGPGGEVAASFPSGGGDVPFMKGDAGIWRTAGENRQARLELSPADRALEWPIGVSVAIVNPPPPLSFRESLADDRRWSLALGLAVLFCIASWVRFFWKLRGRADSSPPVPSAEKRPVRVPAAVRSAVADSRLIVAEIDDAGKVTVSSGMPPVPGAAPRGSLRRLQALHRGSDSLQGSRILDRAKSPLLRRLARTVRPGGGSPGADGAGEGRVPDARAAGRAAAGGRKA